jgi:hypothetical protein
VPTSAPPPAPVPATFVPTAPRTGTHPATPEVEYPQELPVYFDASNEDEAAQMLAAENARQVRLLQLRKAATTVQPPAVQLMSKPPHLAAAEAEYGSAERPISLGKNEEGIETYRMPVAEAPLLEQTQRRGPAPEMNPQGGGRTNPNFRRPKKL